jgi:hypothetical protein
VTTNKNIVKFNYTFKNDEIQSFSMSSSWEHFVVLSKMWVYFSMKLPQTATDKNYQREFAKSVVDVEKLMNGSHSNFAVSWFAGRFKECCIDEITFPMKKVSQKVK